MYRKDICRVDTVAAPAGVSQSDKQLCFYYSSKQDVAGVKLLHIQLYQWKKAKKFSLLDEMSKRKSKAEILVLNLHL